MFPNDVSPVYLLSAIDIIESRLDVNSRTPPRASAAAVCTVSTSGQNRSLSDCHEFMPAYPTLAVLMQSAGGQDKLEADVLDCHDSFRHPCRGEPDADVLLRSRPELQKCKSASKRTRTYA